MPTISQLQYIVALHRTGHFGRAAAECHVSQPTLSALIAKAEDELGVTLFDRRTRPVTPTEPGRALIALAQEVLLAHERLLAAARGPTRIAGPFTLGIIPTLAPYVLPWFLGPFTSLYPEVTLTVLERTTEQIIEALQGSRLDAGILATPLGEPTLTERVLFYDPFYVYAHDGAELLARDTVTVADLHREGLWLLEDGHCFRQQVTRLCGLRRTSPLTSVRFEAGSFETLRALIDRTGGFTLLPESYARTLPPDLRRHRVRPFEEPTPTREVSLVSHRAHWQDAILDAMTEVLRSNAPRSLPRERGDAEVLPIQS